LKKLLPFFFCDFIVVKNDMLRAALDVLNEESNLQKPFIINVDDSDDKSDNDSLMLQPIEEDREDNGEQYDILAKGISLRLGQPSGRKSVIENFSLFLDDDWKGQDLSLHESPELKPIRPELLDNIGDAKERGESVILLSAFSARTGSLSRKDTIEILFTPGRKSTRISEAGSSTDLRRISLRLTEKLVLKKRNPKDDYNLKKVVGTGTFGKVIRAICKKTNKEVAIKRIKKKKLDEMSKGLLQNEIRIHTEIKHESVVCLYDTCETPKYICLIMELCTGGDVFDLLEKEEHLDEIKAAGMIHQIVTAVDYIHNRGVVHRDLKLENILIVKDKIKIADFGFATTIKTQKSLMDGTCGSLNYVAPEVLTKKPYSKACDLWSIGVILYCMLAGYLPFYEFPENGGRPKTFRRIQLGLYDFEDPVWSNVGALAKSVVTGLLTVQVGARLTCEQVAKHQWIRSSANTAKRQMS